MGAALLTALSRGRPHPHLDAQTAMDRSQHKEVARSLRRARALERHVPKSTVGAEIGVFWAHFSERILTHFQPKKLYLVDPWDKLFGETYPDWGEYTYGGALKTADAKAAAEQLVQDYPDRVEVVVAKGDEFLAGLPDGTLDWVYLDAEHRYESVLADLRAIAPKLTPEGIILGDDYYLNDKSQHRGVLQAVNAFAHETKRKLVLEDAYQYILLPENAKRP